MLSDSVFTSTGFGLVTRNIMNRLNKSEFDCNALGHNYVGHTLAPPIKFEDGTVIDFKVHGAGKAPYSLDMISPTIKDNDVDVFGILLDLFMVHQPNATFMNVDTSPAKTFFYFPSDGGGTLPITCEHILRKVHVPISMSKFGKMQAEKLYDIKCHYIPHGVDINTFFPLSEEQKLASRKFWMLQNKFVVGVVARNQGRKSIDLTLKAFKVFCQDKPDAILFMHMDPDDGAQAFDINNVINRLQLNNRVIFSGTTFHRPFSIERMNEVYNLMDVFLLSTSGEGFGVPTIEAMSCGVPQVITDYTSSRELVMDDIQTGLLIRLAGMETDTPHPHLDEPINGTITGGWNVERGIASVSDTVTKLNMLYNDREMLKKFSDNSVIKAKKYYDWDTVVIPMWEQLFREMCGR